MKNLKLFDPIINLTWLGVVTMLLLLGTTMYNHFRHANNVSAKPNDEGHAIFVADDKASIKIKDGKTLFRNNCASCHNKNMVDDLTGPALKGVTARWGEYPKADLNNWIKNSGKLIDAKHPMALSIWTAWDKKPMTSFTHLSDEEIDSIIAYIER